MQKKFDARHYMLRDIMSKRFEARIPDNTSYCLQALLSKFKASFMMTFVEYEWEPTTQFDFSIHLIIE